MSAESSLTPQTAPRTVDGLLRETAFKLRLLVGTLEGLKTEEQKMAWHALTTPEARAQYVLKLLTEWDAARGGAPAPQQQVPHTNGAVQHQQAPAGPVGPAPGGFPATQFQMPTPMQPVAPGAVAPGAPPNVGQQAASQAQAAAGGDSGKRTRTPKTGGGGADAADVGAQVLSMLQDIHRGLAAEAQQRLDFQKQLISMLEEAGGSKASRVTALESKYAEVAASLQHLSGATQSQANVQLWTLMAFLTLASEQTGGSVVQVLGTAIQDSAMFQKFVDQAMGKAG